MRARCWESFVTKTRDKAAAFKFLKKTLKRHGSPKAITTDGLRSYGAAMRELGDLEKREVGRWANNRAENSHQPFRRRERAMLRFSEDENTPDLRLGPRLLPQPLQPGTHPRRPPDLQGPTLSRTGRVARGRGLTQGGVGDIAPEWRQVAVGLTAPLQRIGFPELLHPATQG